MCGTRINIASFRAPQLQGRSPARPRASRHSANAAAVLYYYILFTTDDTRDIGAPNLICTIQNRPDLMCLTRVHQTQIVLIYGTCGRCRSLHKSNTSRVYYYNHIYIIFFLSCLHWKFNFLNQLKCWEITSVLRIFVSAQRGGRKMYCINILLYSIHESVDKFCLTYQILIGRRVTFVPLLITSLPRNYR